jgi:hypothetical protein
MKTRKHYALYILAAALVLMGPASFIALKAAARSPETVEYSYSRVIFPVVTGITTFFSGRVHFALIEILAPIFVAVVLIWLFYNIFGLVFKKARLRRLGRTVLVVITLASLLYAWYNVSFSLNFYRVPAAQSLGISVPKTITASQLEKTAMALAKNVNAVCDKVTFSKNGTAAFPVSMDDELQRVIAEYQKKASQYPVLSGERFVLKQSYYSEFLNRIFITGYYSPFTGEAVVNNRFPAFYATFSAAHELSHQRGFSKEDEANFLAFFVLQDSQDPFIRYSANLSALLYVLNALDSVDHQAVQRVFTALDKRAGTELAQYNKFLSNYYGSAQKISEKLNDTYLKSFGQKDGVQSYDRVVILLAALYLSGGIDSY